VELDTLLYYQGLPSNLANQNIVNALKMRMHDVIKGYLVAVAWWVLLCIITIWFSLGENL